MGRRECSRSGTFAGPSLGDQIPVRHSFLMIRATDFTLLTAGFEPGASLLKRGLNIDDAKLPIFHLAMSSHGP